MGISIANRCLQCGLDQETRNHLFVECSYSKQVWRTVLALCGLTRRSICWDDELMWFCPRLKGISQKQAEASDVPKVKALPTETVVVVVVEETLIESTNTAQQTTTDHSRNLLFLLSKRAKQRKWRI
ncbi:hypothetical protein GQ457_10G019170 [Hibiscus cannabinus]